MNNRPEPSRQWERLSFTGDPEDEASVKSAINAAEAAGDPLTGPRIDREVNSRSQVVAVGPRLAAIRAERTPEETALLREVSRFITEYREAHHFPQGALAEQLGLPQPVLARLELGLDLPSLDTLALLSRGLDVTFDIQITPDGIRLRSAA